MKFHNRENYSAETELGGWGPPGKGQEGTFWGDQFVKHFKLNTEEMCISLYANHT